MPEKDIPSRPEDPCADAPCGAKSEQVAGAEHVKPVTSPATPAAIHSSAMANLNHQAEASVRLPEQTPQARNVLPGYEATITLIVALIAAVLFAKKKTRPTRHYEPPGPGKLAAILNGGGGTVHFVSELQPGLPDREWIRVPPPTVLRS